MRASSVDKSVGISAGPCGGPTRREGSSGRRRRLDCCRRECSRRSLGPADAMPGRCGSRSMPGRWCRQRAERSATMQYRTAEWVARSPAPDLPIPEVALHEFALRCAGYLADKPALIDGPTGRTLSYGRLARQADRVAAGLQRRGLAKGQVVGLCSPNCPEDAIPFLAVARAGGVATTISPLATSAELAWQLRDAQARFLVAAPAALDKARAAAQQVPSLHEVFVFGHGD